MADTKPNDPTDPNEKKVLDAMREHGETLRKVEEGKTATEIGLDLDLGIKLDDAETMDEMGERVPEPPPVDPAATDNTFAEMGQRIEPATHDAVFAEMGERIEPEAPPPFDVPLDVPEIEAPQIESPTPQTPTQSVQQIQSDHGKAFIELGQRIVQPSQIEDEQPTPLTTTFTELEQTTFPGGQQTEHLSGGLQDFLREDSSWRSELSAFFRLLAMEIHQHREELNEIHAYLERNR